ncbi:MAG: hypothetical protein JNL08_01775 [Planctomycetes bacterium]|nr:hypothetical protein [Planctomycetota bacterium]
MHTPDDERNHAEAMRRLLADAVPEVPIAATKVRATAARAVAEAAARRRFRRLGAVAASVAVLVALVAGYRWRWSGDHIDDLSFRQAIDITRVDDGYEKGRVQAAAGKVSMDITRMLSRLIERGALTDELKAAMLEALDSPVPIAVPYAWGVEDLRRKLEAGVALMPSEMAQLKQAIYAAVHTIRALGERREDMREITDSICFMFRRYVTVIPIEREQERLRQKEPQAEGGLQDPQSVRDPQDHEDKKDL